MGMPVTGRVSPAVPFAMAALLLAPSACADGPTEPPPSVVGFLVVTTATTGATPDPTGYSLALDDGSRQPVAINDVVTLTLVEGSYAVELANVAFNCQVAGQNPRAVAIVRNETIRITFDVACSYVLREIAFSSDREAHGCEGWLWSCNDIYVMGADGVSPERLTDSGAYHDEQPVWSPDASKILLTREDADGYLSIYVMDADGSNMMNLTRGSADSDPAWSPDGTRILFTRGSGSNDSEVFALNADGTQPVNLTAAPGRDAQPAWSPDGTRIAFASDRASGECGDWGWFCDDIYVMDADGANVVRLTHGDELDDAQPVWARDGSRILFSRTDQTGVTAIHVMDPDGSGILQLTAGPDDFDPAWSPDGSRIVFTRGADTGPETEVYVMAADGSDPVNITNRPGEDRTPAWLPVAPDPAAAAPPR